MPVKVPTTPIYVWNSMGVLRIIHAAKFRSPKASIGSAPTKSWHVYMKEDETDNHHGLTYVWVFHGSINVCVLDRTANKSAFNMFKEGPSNFSKRAVQSSALLGKSYGWTSPFLCGVPFNTHCKIEAHETLAGVCFCRWILPVPSCLYLRTLIIKSWGMGSATNCNAIYK